jgi:hypothetical protein
VAASHGVSSQQLSALYLPPSPPPTVEAAHSAKAPPIRSRLVIMQRRALALATAHLLAVAVAAHLAGRRHTTREAPACPRLTGRLNSTTQRWRCEGDSEGG